MLGKTYQKRKRFFSGFLLAIGFLLIWDLTDNPFVCAGNPNTMMWNFDAHPAGGTPEGFHIGTLYDGRPAGEWKIVEAKDVPSPPHALGQLMNKGAEHAYKMVLIDGTQGADLELQVSFFAVAGKGDMGGGLIWRAQDDRNYYLTRANPLEQNVRIYHVVKGVKKCSSISTRSLM